MEKLLIVIDMQNDFIDGALGSTEANEIVANVAKKIELYRNENQGVIFTRDTHSEDYMATQEGKNLPVKHCIYNTDGWQISKKLNVSDSVIVNKPSFGSLELAKYVSENFEVNEIELVGLCTDICVISNAMILKAAMPELKITVDASCCAGVTTQSHKNALEAMKMCQVNVINEE